MEEYAYKIYVTDALMAIADNISKISGGSIMKQRYADMLPQKYDDTIENSQESQEKAQEIIERIKKGVNAL